MKTQRFLALCLLFLGLRSGYALEPAEILIIANSEVAESVKIAEYYCAKRGVPKRNILKLPLGADLKDAVTRRDYKRKIAAPIREKLAEIEFAGKIRCLLTTYGVPFIVGGRSKLEGHEDTLKELEKQVAEEKNKLQLVGQSRSAISTLQKERIELKLAKLESHIGYILGKETIASVDSELSMVLRGEYELYRWQRNNLRSGPVYWDFSTLMVSRLDGPGWQIAQGLVDKAMAAERKGLVGIAYIDSGYPKKKKNQFMYTKYDESLRNLGVVIKNRTQIPVVEERSKAVFAPGQCPSTALYCGWYSLKKYVDAFDFVDGAIGYHIASWEAQELRNPDSTRWCPAMLKDGITATLGPVYEPYLHSFPKPIEFFTELFNGRCLVEAYYYTKPFNSWQHVLIGDPLYTPFKPAEVDIFRETSTK